MVRVVVINGPGRSGKDTLVEFVTAHYHLGPCLSHSTVGTVKLASKYFGADETIHKGDRERRLWSDLKDAWTRYNDGPFRELMIAASDLEKDNFYSHPLLFVMVREPPEIARLKRQFGRHCVTVLVTAEDRVKHIPGNHADQNVFNFEYDIIVNNGGSLEDLEGKAKNLAGYLTDSISIPWEIPLENTFECKEQNI